MILHLDFFMVRLPVLKGVSSSPTTSTKMFDGKISWKAPMVKWMVVYC